MKSLTFKKNQKDIKIYRIKKDMSNCKNFEKIKQEPKETLLFYKIYCYCNKFETYVTFNYCSKCESETNKKN